MKLLREFQKAPPQDKPMRNVYKAERLFNETAFDRKFKEFCNTEIAHQVFSQPKELIDVQCDREYLASLPAGSLGREFLEFMDENLDFYAGYLYEGYKKEWEDHLDTEEKKRFSSRMFACHDFTHLVIGWNRMILGEAHAAAFHSVREQNDSNSFKALIKVGYLKVLRTTKNLKTTLMFKKSIDEAREVGKKIPWLPTVDWESMMAWPLEDVRKHLNISEQDIENYREIQQRYRTEHVDLFKAEYDDVAKKQYEVCVGPNAKELQSVAATQI
jgi:ubiquinone biosynthesis protein COQ4